MTDTLPFLKWQVVWSAVSGAILGIIAGKVFSANTEFGVTVLLGGIFIIVSGAFTMSYLMLRLLEASRRGEESA